MEEEKETLKGQVSGLREGQINRAGQPQPQSNEPDRNPQEKRLLQARSSIDEIVCESEKPSGFFSSEQNEQNDVHNVHHVHTSESTQELNNAELEKHVATVESIIERAKEDANGFVHVHHLIGWRRGRSGGGGLGGRCGLGALGGRGLHGGVLSWAVAGWTARSITASQWYINTQ